ncbi:probable ubiquitin-conjugating enzyme E2 24 [Magnolia sinica]|uniref:probable ubiquitin-conjugating enzyme E2 24 n=1 Tax=Magnolia sinica TaxID=86752 RepID=UPI00265AFF55|nr:probable ubiquitin-conjugating enzyme E2 24 [Magnolia sinica]XP_058101032.1 probable ubiquitin-conjugating enzyme E2 24 [Magnolia sinica]
MMNMLLSDSDWDGYSMSSDSEDQDDIESMFGGRAQSILSSLTESIGKIDDFLAFERGFAHGDIVCSITDPSGQMGRVVDVDIVVGLETMSGDIIKDVNSKKLLKFRSLAAGDYVVHGPWLGRVGRVVDLVTILFDDGAKCEITTANPENLTPISPNSLEDALYPYYPGQRVRIRHSTAFKSARWLCGKWTVNRDEGVVCHVEIGSLYVNWIASIMVGCKFGLPAPPSLQDPKNLTLLSCFPHANWQLGDWCMLPIDAYRDHQMGVKEQACPNVSAQGLFKTYKNFGRVPHRRDPDCENIFIVVKTKTKVDVVWQDGSHSFSVDSQTLIPVDNVGDHDFWPDQFVLEKGTYDNDHVSTGQRFGIVKSVDAKERTVKVKWTTPRTNRTAEEFNEEIVSAYELIEHPDYSYCLGDVVFRLEASLHVTQTEGQTQSQEDPQTTEMDMASLQALGKEMHGKKQIDEGQDGNIRSYLSCIGNVIGFKDECIEVRWASGLISKVGPSEIVGIDRYEDPAATPAHQEDVEDNASEEMMEHDKQSWNKKEKDVLEKAVDASGEDCKQDLWDGGLLLLPRSAIGFLTSVATSLFGSRGSTSLSRSTNSTSSDTLKSCNLELQTPGLEAANEFGFFPWKKASKCQILKAEEPSPEVDDLQISGETILKQKVEETQANKEPPLTESGEKLGEFKKFDTVNDYTDHHFVNGAGKGWMLSQVKKGWLKKVQHEWSLLEKDLPDTIYVRVYEERIDLMRAAIIGAPGTPYHDGLFFFDIFLPPDYPYEPPLVHYNSGGLKLNPNLYESGRVCLSLLKTWTGTGTEVWNPESSTILQVLLSLQALVLNEKPYFNEAGYDKQIGRAEGEKNSTTYNENAFLLSLRSMLYLLRKPPKHFESLVEEHFRHCAHSILLACKAYMGGAQVGRAFGCGNTPGESQQCSSTGFKIILAKLLPKLISGFTEQGIDCCPFLEEENKVPKTG